MERIVIEGRALFAHLSNPIAQGYHEGEYGVTIAFGKTDSKTLCKVDEAIRQATEEKWGGNPPADIKTPLQDGNKKSAYGLDGHYYIEARSKYKPPVVDRMKQPIEGGQEIPKGCRCNFVLNFQGYDVDSNTGVSCYLCAVQHVKNEHWTNSSRRIVDELFKVIDDDN